MPSRGIFHCKVEEGKMIPLKFFNKTEKEKFIKLLEEQFGIKEIPGQIARFGKERIMLFSKEISEKDIQILDKVSRIEGIGVYFAKEHPDGIRLSIEGTQLLKNQITKNIFELNEKQAEEWMLGQELSVQTEKRGFFVIKFKEDLMGTGKVSENRITNFVPKSRRLKPKKSPTQSLS